MPTVCFVFLLFRCHCTLPFSLILLFIGQLEVHVDKLASLYLYPSVDIFLYIRSVEVANEVIVESKSAQVVKDTNTLIDSVNIVQPPADRWSPPKYTAGKA